MKEQEQVPARDWGAEELSHNFQAWWALQMIAADYDPRLDLPLLKAVAEKTWQAARIEMAQELGWQVNRVGYEL
jgi:hypothetical protein